tara:strand:- start:191 stop:460 length:270 start_codon:yes stop_codon:yes gene_type:complete
MATKKLDKDHLEQIKSLQQQYADNANTLGNLSIERFTLESRMDEILKLHDEELAKFETIRMKERDLMTKLKERYGDGSINIEAGTFTES